MKKSLALALALAGALSVSGCYTPQQQTGTLAGGAIGAGGGALIGSALTGGSAGGAIAGGILGAGTGALIGNAVTAPRHRCARWGWDALGQPRLPRLVLINPRFARHGYRSRHGAASLRPARAAGLGT